MIQCKVVIRVQIIPLSQGSIPNSTISIQLHSIFCTFLIFRYGFYPKKGVLGVVCRTYLTVFHAFW